jgi:hypothetical protein
MFQVLISRRVLRHVDRLPESIQDRFANLVEDLKLKGPIQPQWPNYSRLSATEYHCHLSHRWVACWYHSKGTVRIEVYYAGSRQDAPY